MSEINQVTISGNLTKDVEVKQSKSGVSYARFRIANNHWDKEKNESTASFLNVVAFGKNTKLLQVKGKKGQQILVTGRLDSQIWEDNKGIKRETVTITAFDIELIEKVKLNQNADDRQKTGLQVENEPKNEVVMDPKGDKYLAAVNAGIKLIDLTNNSGSQPSQQSTVQQQSLIQPEDSQSSSATNDAAAEDPFENQDSLDVDIDESDIPF